MRKKVWICVGIILIVLVAAGIVTNYADSGRVATGHEPKYCVKAVSEDGSKVTYWGLGYKVIRYVGVSPKEPYESNIGVKMGSWFMKYDLPEERIITVEQEKKVIEIRDYDHVNTISNILVNSKYDSEISKEANTHKIMMENETYYLKESCQAVQKGEKQAEITKEDLDTILDIIEKSQE